jgi:D-aminoacyl-tRNA deacylase
MRAVICRVDRASVCVEDQVVGRIDRGLLVYIGVITGDTADDAAWLVEKLLSIRLFSDDAGKMNLSVADVGGGLLLIPNFTLAGRTRKGTRPSFSDAAASQLAAALFQAVADACSARVPTATGVFGAHMLVDSACNGPVTVTLDSRSNVQAAT